VPPAAAATPGTEPARRGTPSRRAADFVL